MAMKNSVVLFFVALASSYALHAQLTISSNSTLKANGDVSVRGSVNNNSSQTDLSSAHVVLTGANQTLNTSAPLSLAALSVTGGGTKTLQGEWTITQDLAFTQGIVTIGTGKLRYTGSTALNGNSGSFVNGILFQRGTGLRFFPIGVGSAYAPMAFGSIQDGAIDIGVQVFASNPSLTLPPDLSAIATNRYWEVTTSGAIRGSAVSLYVPGSSIDGSQRITVAEADALGGTAVNLGGGISDDFAVSFSSATKPILTLGIAESVDLRINDLITPYNSDDINDKLKIFNINYTYQNTVTLLDRWGVPVKKWTNFTNYDDPANPNTDTFDFSGLSPGNYICVLEYQLSADAPKETMTQMISVLKGN
jgi:hypothetical protein